MMLRFTKAELEALTKKARKAGLSRENFCRRVLAGAVVREAPPAEAAVLIGELRRVGRSLEQIRKAAGAQGLPEEAQLREALVESRAAARQVVRAYTLEG